MPATVTVAAKREKLRKIAEEILNNSGESISVTIEGEVKGSEGSWVNIVLSNDDMERDDIADDTVYVEIDLRIGR